MAAKKKSTAKRSAAKLPVRKIAKKIPSKPAKAVVPARAAPAVKLVSPIAPEARASTLALQSFLEGMIQAEMTSSKRSVTLEEAARRVVRKLNSNDS